MQRAKRRRRQGLLDNVYFVLAVDLYLSIRFIA
jgi:hypothetical protein